MEGPFVKGTPEQGDQSGLTPAQLYRKGLAALDRYCRTTYGNKAFAQLADDDKDKVLTALEKGAVDLGDVDAKTFFKHVLNNTQEGFFADPVYGGNRGMASWKMIGFPGARYDYRDWIDRHNETYPLPPVGIMGRADYTPKGAS
jgi:gluconate 2-dehydrogenase gamma chain